MKWNVAVYDDLGVSLVMTFGDVKETCLEFANEMNRWMVARPHWKMNATYVAFPVPCVG